MRRDLTQLVVLLSSMAAIAYVTTELILWYYHTK